jgi:signal transduction histidine kinase
MDVRFRLVSALHGPGEGESALQTFLDALCEELGLEGAAVRHLPTREASIEHALTLVKVRVTRGPAEWTAPLAMGARTIGALDLHGDRARVFDPEASSLLTDLLPFVALRLDHLLHERRQRHVRELAARVSHETSNPLAVVLANLDYLEHFSATLAGRVAEDELDAVRGAVADTRDALARLKLVSATLHRFTPSQGLPALSFDPLAVIKSPR